MNEKVKLSKLFWTACILFAALYVVMVWSESNQIKPVAYVIVVPISSPAGNVSLPRNVTRTKNYSKSKVCYRDFSYEQSQ